MLRVLDACSEMAENLVITLSTSDETLSTASMISNKISSSLTKRDTIQQRTWPWWTWMGLEFDGKLGILNFVEFLEKQ